MLTLKQVQRYTGPGGSTQQVHHKHILRSVLMMGLN